MYYILRVFWLAVTPAFNYLIQFTVRKTCIDYDGLRMSRRATFHCIAIRVFNWNSKWLTTTSWKSNNGWTSSYRRWVNFSVIRSWSEVYCSFYFPICGTGVMTERNPTATWKTWSKRENRKSCSELPPVFMTFSYVNRTSYVKNKPWSCRDFCCNHLQSSWNWCSTLISSKSCRANNREHYIRTRNRKTKNRNKNKKKTNNQTRERSAYLSNPTRFSRLLMKLFISLQPLKISMQSRP